MINYRTVRDPNFAVQSLVNLCVNGMVRAVWDDSSLLLVHTISATCLMYAMGKAYVYRYAVHHARYEENYEVNLNLFAQCLSHFCSSILVLKQNVVMVMIDHARTKERRGGSPHEIDNNITLHIFDDLEDVKPLVDLAYKLLDSEVSLATTGVRAGYIALKQRLKSATSDLETRTCLKEILTVPGLMTFTGGRAHQIVSDLYRNEFTPGPGNPEPCSKCVNMYEKVSARLSLIWIYLHVFSDSKCAPYYIIQNTIQSLPAFMPACQHCIAHAIGNIPKMMEYLEEVKNGRYDVFQAVVNIHNFVNLAVSSNRITDQEFEDYMRSGIDKMFVKYGRRALTNANSEQSSTTPSAPPLVNGPGRV